MNLTYGSHCSKCKRNLILGNRIEKHVYYVGDDEIKFSASVPTGTCPLCSTEYEGDSAKMARKEAMQDALDQYWLSKLDGQINVAHVNQLKNACRRLILNGDRKRRMSEEFGLWLAGLHFPP